MFRLLRSIPRPPSAAPHARPRCSTTSSSSYTNASKPQTPPSKRAFLSAYISTLRSRYPLVDPASLIASFLIIHELTAIVPLGVGFWGLKTLGVGEKAVEYILDDEKGGVLVEREGGEETWLKRGAKRWVVEGEKRAEGIGRRYGLFGYEKESREERVERRKRENEGEGAVEGDVPTTTGYAVSGDVANLAVAYVLVKVLMPVRILLSIRLAPPMANVLVRRFQSLRNIGARYLKKST
ncbi:hypothetical protein MNV49_000712 [Pseudohyphozyma bogoriensis]|nr:hypothetical protein MNV49_000712 [Pseudohyphozyma bogoriensis]